MNFKIHRLLIVLAALGGPEMARAQGTAFTYQGRLNDGSVPANGSYDFRFRLAADPLAGNYASGDVLTNGVLVTNGLFTVAMDFGAGVFTGSNLWLEAGVRTNGGSGYVALNPLQALTPTPYAIMAGGASNLLGTVSSGQLSGAYSGAVTFSNPANSFNGSFAGNGAGLTNLSQTPGGGWTGNTNQFNSANGATNIVSGVTVTNQNSWGTQTNHADIVPLGSQIIQTITAGTNGVVLNFTVNEGDDNYAPNEIFRYGWNMDARGQIINTNQGAMDDEMEQWYLTSGQHYMERHSVFMYQPTNAGASMVVERFHTAQVRADPLDPMVGFIADAWDVDNYHFAVVTNVNQDWMTWAVNRAENNAQLFLNNDTRLQFGKDSLGRGISNDFDILFGVDSGGNAMQLYGQSPSRNASVVHRDGGEFDLGATNIWLINSPNITGDPSFAGTATFNGTAGFNQTATFKSGLVIPTGAVNGFVLTSDGSGNATWQTLPAGGGGSGWTGNANQFNSANGITNIISGSRQTNNQFYGTTSMNGPLNALGLSNWVANIIGLQYGFLDMSQPSRTLIGNGAGAAELFSANDSEDVAIGHNALFSFPASATNHYTVAVGSDAGGNAVGGAGGVTIGQKSMVNATNIQSCVAVGGKAMSACLYPNSDVAVGYGANQWGLGGGPSPGGQRVDIGYDAGTGDSGHDNVFIGFGSGPQRTDGSAVGSDNVGIGSLALNSLVGSVQNVAVGYKAGYAVTGVGNLTALGYQAAVSIGSPNNFIAIGAQSALGWTSGTSDILLGTSAGQNLINQNNTMIVGHDSTATAITNVFFGGDAVSTTASSWPVTFNATGGNGANVAGANLTVAGGKGTGDGAGGSVNLAVALAGGSGATPNPLTNALTVSAGGITANPSFQFNGNGSGLTNVSVAMVVGGMSSQSPGSGHTYQPYLGGIAGGASSEPDVELACPRGGTAANLYIHVSPPLSAGQNATVSIMTNGVDSNITAVIAGDGGTVSANDTTHAINVTAGTRLSIDWSTTAGSPGPMTFGWSFVIQ